MVDLINVPDFHTRVNLLTLMLDNIGKLITVVEPKPKRIVWLTALKEKKKEKRKLIQIRKSLRLFYPNCRLFFRNLNFY